MKIVRSVLFPALMLVGLVLSVFVIATSLQAATEANVPAARGTTSVVATNQVAQGRALFLAKGCIVCHRHDGLSTARAGFQEFYLDSAPNLATLKVDPAYLHRWLADPQAIKPNTEMPNLNLSESEIDALVAFLTNK